MKKLALSALLSVLLAACATKPATTDTTTTANTGTTTTTTTNNDTAAGTDTTSTANTQSDLEAKRLADEQAAADAQKRMTDNLLKSRSIYFGLDQYDIASEYQSIVQTHADYAKSSGAKVRIEGNTDERGSREYNLALGQKRAAAVARAMQVLGVDQAKIETISNGEEKPTAEGSDEEAWAVNRRADIVYPDLRQ